MYLRRAEMKDLPQIESIIQDGKTHLAAQHIDQWQGDIPIPASWSTTFKMGTQWS